MDFRNLYLVDKRIATFKKWPFDDKCKCSVRNMAEAGFYSCSTGADDFDAAKCFLCGKELDGWDSTDDPWEEHKSHAPKCAFVQLRKQEDQLQALEFLSVVKQYMINEIKRMGEVGKEQLDDKMRNVRRKCLRKK